jgi:hypothetical protein
MSVHVQGAVSMTDLTDYMMQGLLRYSLFFYGTWRFITLFTTACHWALLEPLEVSQYSVSFRSVLIVYCLMSRSVIWSLSFGCSD